MTKQGEWLKTESGLLTQTHKIILQALANHREAVTFGEFAYDRPIPETLPNAEILAHLRLLRKVGYVKSEIVLGPRSVTTWLATTDGRVALLRPLPTRG